MKSQAETKLFKERSALPMAKYKIDAKDLILDNEDKKYILRVRDLAEEDRPREKLIKHGPEFLSAAELLAIVLMMGTKKEGVLALTSRLIKEYGEKNIINQSQKLRWKSVSPGKAKAAEKPTGSGEVKKLRLTPVKKLRLTNLANLS